MTVTKLKPEPAPGHGLDLLRQPFPANQISKLPKETKAQIDARKSDKNVMVFNCTICGGHHHKNAVHLDYVGHAALTDRLLDADIAWNWEPLAFDATGNPAMFNGGMWIKLTVGGVTRLGFGSADGKQGGDAIKEIIGDALRNAAMRFGAALDLWHKGDLHADDGDDAAGNARPANDEWGVRPKDGGPTKSEIDRTLKEIVHEIEGCGDEDMLRTYLETDEYKAGKALMEEYRPSALYGPIPNHAPEFVPLKELVSRKIKLFRMAAETEKAPF